MKQQKIQNHIKTSILMRELNLKLSRIKGADKSILVYPHMGILPMKQSHVIINLN